MSNETAITAAERTELERYRERERDKRLISLSPMELACLVRAKVIPRRIALAELARQGYRLPDPAPDTRYDREREDA